MNESTVTLNTPEGPMDAFQVLPDSEGAGSALIVAMEAFGVNEHIKEVCRRFAREGYTVVAPDFYHRTGRMLTYAYEDPNRREAFSQLTNAGIETDVKAALAHVRTLPGINPARVGIVGFCVGGFISFLAACRTDVTTAVCFYGGGIVNRREGLKLEPLLSEAHQIEGPVLCLFGEKDTSIPLDEVEAVRTKLSIHGPGHEVHVYPDAGHGFFCDERTAYNADAAADAWTRTVKWFDRHLKALADFPSEDY